MMNHDEHENADALRARFRDDEVAVPTGRLGRLVRTGRSAAGMASAVFGGRLRGRGGGLAAADLAAVTKLAARLGELKGIAMKIGQLLGYVDHTLPAEMRELLAVLQTQAPASPWAAVEATIREGFGPCADELLARLDREPIAVASIGQVHRGRLVDGTEVAVKVRHPGIEDAVRVDFGNAAAGALFARLLPGGRSVRALVDEARTALLEECDFALEATRQRAAATWYAGHPTIVIPEPIEAWCTPTILTTRWTPGRSLDAYLASDPSQSSRDRVGLALFELFVGMLYRHGAFHADPHPGNFALLEDGRVVIYDFGCVRTFDRPTLLALAGLVEAVRNDDPAEIDRAMRGIGATTPTKAGPREHVRTLLRGFFAPLLTSGPHPIDPGAALAANDVLRDKRALLGLELPGSLLFLLRLRFGLYAVLARLGAVADWAALETQWANELPR